MKLKCEFQISTHKKRERDLIEKIAKYKVLEPKHFHLLDMPMDEIFQTIGVIERSPDVIWKAICKTYSPAFFSDIIERDFKHLISVEASKDILDQVAAAKRKCDETLEVFAKHSEAEITSLRERLRIAESEQARLNSGVLEQFNLEVKDVENRVEFYWSERLKELKDRFEQEKEDLTEQINSRQE